MGIKVTVKHKIVVNGKEYGSPDEMPENLRDAYERAIAGKQSGMANAQRKSRIVFNGKEYDSPEAMPPEDRKLYELAIAAAELDQAPSANPDSGPSADRKGLIEKDGVFLAARRSSGVAPAAGESRRLAGSKIALITLLVILLAALWFVLSGTGGRLP